MRASRLVLGKRDHRPIGYAWAGLAALGAVAATANVVDAQRDLRKLIASGRDGILKVSAQGSRDDQVFILAALVCDEAAALIALRSSPSSTLFQRFGPYFAFAGTVAMIAASFGQRRRRKALLDALRLRRRAARSSTG